ncbi:MAG: DUF4124 domain-containing protein [Zoogloeaceae bacterium]|jgi:uncharacterized coiled-coil protein SlyX|nr:DUF4124 domain-containing protein [Zoogloeaceae bacterium]
MRNRLPTTLGLLTCAGLFALPAWGQIYRCTGPDGNTVYSNVAADPKCKAVELQPDISIPPPPVADSQTSAPAPDDSRRVALESKLAAARQSLDEARKALAEQQAVRYGSERNYQKVLDRLKPYEDTVAEREQTVRTLSDELSTLK